MRYSHFMFVFYMALIIFDAVIQDWWVMGLNMILMIIVVNGIRWSERRPDHRKECRQKEDKNKVALRPPF